ncbi:MAG: hypothetical protein R3F20_03140 [Planctomycetota bacterium]
MNAKTLVAALVLGAALSLTAPAQCSIAGMGFTPYGTGCSFLFSAPALGGTFDPASCTATLNFGFSPSCCNTFLASRYLIVGNSATQTTIPISPGCTLLAAPDLILELGPVFSDQIAIPIPSWMPPGLTFYLQGANLYFTTIGFSYDLETTNGLLVTTS